MDGTIINYDGESKTGLIRAEDKKRYQFTIANWCSADKPLQGDLVDFEPNDGVASEIFVTSRIAETATVSVATVVETKPTPTDPSGSVRLGAEQFFTPAVSPPLQMPSGFGARFFIAYAVTLIPTYVLPYFGSNSLMVNGILSASGGMPAPFWWHISCYAVLIFVAFIRGARISRLWLSAFPVLAAIFDLLPVINNIPLVPTVFNLAALYVGSSRRAPEGYAVENLDQKIEFGLWGISAFSAFAIFKIWNSPFSAGNGFASSLLLWPVLGLAVFFAWKYRIGEGASMISGEMARFETTASSAGISNAKEAAETARYRSAFAPDNSSLPSKQAEVTAVSEKFCADCGHSNDPTDQFCAECGVRT